MSRSFCNRNPGFIAALAVAGCVVLAARPAMAEASADGTPAQADVFRKFADTSVERALSRPILQLFAERRYADAEHALRRLLAKFPDSPLYRYNLAAAQARQNKNADALDNLAAAVRAGFTSAEIIQRDPDLDSLRGQARYKSIVAELEASAKERSKRPAARIAPAKVVDGRAPVGLSNTSWNPAGNILISLFEFEPNARATTVYDATDEVAKRLNAWFEKGRAAGNHGDLYDNRDRGHSLISGKRLPQISHIDYGKEARAAGVDYGVNAGILFNAVTIGNSSTALTNSAAWRSQARLILTSTDLIGKAYLQYLNNHLYIYPEHLDHDSRRGDLLPANTPYILISQGSSGSDQPFLHAAGAILAAFQPKVKQYLRQTKLTMPTVQMIFRRGQAWATNDADYLSGRAHPSVFPAKNIDLVKMIDLANGLKGDEVPPAVHLSVVEEDKAETGLDYFAPAALGERLFDTPGAIARLVRSTRYWKRLVVSAAQTKDPNGRPLTFRWVVLRGDASRIQIKRLDREGTKVELRIPWHERRAVPSQPDIMTDRVDIGVFADNGKNLSAPAFVTFLYPGDQQRSYGANGKIRCIDYDKPGYRERYVDPVIFPERDWRDCYDYDESGALVGWNRIKGGSLQRFAWDGAKVVETDVRGRPNLAERVRYEMQRTKDGLPKIVQVRTGQFVTYRYRDARDRIGVSAPRPN